MTLFDADEYLPTYPLIHVVPVCIWCNEPIAAIPVDGSDRDPGTPWGTAEKWAYVATQDHLRTCPAVPDERRPAPHSCDGCPDP